MTLIAVPIFVGGVGEVDAALERARNAVSRGARMVEWRIDALAEETGGAKATIQLVRESPAPCVVTCRCAREGGSFEGDEHQRISLIEQVVNADHKPRYIDIEFAAIIREPGWRELINQLHASQQGRDVQTGVMFSVHDFTRRPADLLQQIEAMSLDPTCAVIKVVWRARSVRDNLEAFDLLRERRKPMIALCVGPPDVPEVGLMNRVLSPKFGGLLSFASAAPGMESAPGQLTVDEMCDLYRFDSINENTKVYGIIGWPVAHSLSPKLHNAAFTAANENAVYLPLPVPQEWEHFKATVGALVDHPRLGFRGASVTIPHKENLLRFVEERGGRVDKAAAYVGAANTLIVGTTGAIACANTDAPAAVSALYEGMAIAPEELAEKTVAVLGAGGVARAVSGGLAEIGAKIVIFARNPVRAEEVAAIFHGRETASGKPSHVVAGRLDALNCACFDVIVNCTPVGMASGPAPAELPLGIDLARTIDQTVTVFDTVYAPIETPLVKEARARGATVVTGEKMFFKQAEMQFRTWTGGDAPTGIYL